MRKPRSISRAARLLSAPLLLAGLLGSGLAPAQAATAGCQSWTGTQPPSPGTNASLAGVTMLSACDAWAVGSFEDSHGVLRTLIEHWNGSNWTVVPSPSPGSGQSLLNSVRAASPANIWAVGEFASAGPGPADKTLILHWDGAHWTQQDSPNPGSANDELSGVRAVSGSEAWAVGESFDGTTDKSLVLHLTGGRWHQVTVPLVLAGGLLNSVAASSATDVWAVGRAFTGNGSERSLILHWNGKTWADVPIPSLGTKSSLLAVGVSSAASAVAVGDFVLADGSDHTLTLRWNGRAWTRVPSPSPGLSGSSTDDGLSGVTLTSKDNGWAVGRMATSSGERVLIERWNGSHWTTVPDPGPDTASDLAGIAASSATSAWAVGEIFGPTANQALAVHCC